jgi:hypothetical protein
MSYIYDFDNEYGGRILADDAATADLTLGRTIKSNPTAAVLKFNNMSCASVALIDFGNNYISSASIGTANFTVGQANKWIVVRAGNENLGMPLFSLSTIVFTPGAYV